MNRFPFLLPAALTVVALLTGCAVRNPYVSPTSGDTAKVRFINSSNGTALIQKADDCGHSEAKIIAAFSKFLSQEKTRVGMVGSQEYENNGDVVERIVEANKEMQLFVAHQGSNGIVTTSCYVSAAFTPKKDQQYEVGFTSLSRSCTLSVNDLSEIDGKIHREKTSDVRSLVNECRKGK